MRLGMNLKDVFSKSGTTQGVYHLSGGEIGYTVAIDNQDGTFELRYESGWYCTYAGDGKRETAGVIRYPDGSTKSVDPGMNRNIVKFEALDYDEAKLIYPELKWGFNL